MRALGLGLGIPLALGKTCTRVSAPGYVYDGSYNCGPGPTALPGILLASILGGLGYLALQAGLPLSASAATGSGPDRVSAFMTYNQSLKVRLALDDDSLEDEQDQKPRPPPSARLLPGFGVLPLLATSTR